jgi:hypothetical protein
MESTTQPQDAATRRQLDIVNYETAVLTAEMALAEQTKQAPEAGIANLHDRPHVVYLLESRAAGIVITGLQHLAWALSHRLRFLRRRRAAAAPLPEFPPSETIAAYDRPALASVNFDASLLTRRPRILLDITPTARDPNARGGIPRVIAELARAGVETGLGWPVVIAEGGLRPYYTHPDLPDVVEPGPGDIYVIADIFWYFLPQYRRTVAMLRAAGAEIGLFVHDIFPQLHHHLAPGRKRDYRLFHRHQSRRAGEAANRRRAAGGCRASGHRGRAAPQLHRFVRWRPHIFKRRHAGAAQGL